MSTPDADDPLTDLLSEHLDRYFRQLVDPEPPRHKETAEYGAPLSQKDNDRLERAKRCVERLVSAAKARQRDGPAAISQHTPSSPSRGAETSAEQPVAPIRGIDRFEVLSTLGAGGFGVVYKAYDSRTKREVAVKVPRLEVLASPQMRRRFELEASAAAQLDHPNIISVLEAGDSDGVPFIVSPYVEGPTLGSWLKSHGHSISPRQAALLTRQLALAVQHAHDRGVLHRDIKPSNVMLAPAEGGSDPADPKSFVPKLMDFGLAKLANSAETMTGTGMILGTVRYMAPEQARGEQASITTKTDVYGLGAILFELLAGRAPFEGASDIEIMGKVVGEEPTRVRTLRSAVPPDLETICLKCLEKEPARRYPSARDLAADLTRFLDGEPIQARPATMLERCTKWSRRHPAAAALIALAVVSGITLTAGALWYNARLSDSLMETRASEQRALAREQTARQLAYCADMQLLDQRWGGATYSQLMTILERHRPEANQPDVRGFEWWLYWRQLTTDRQWEALGKHEGGATAVAMTVDSSRAASAGKDGVIRLWSVPDRALLAELRGHAADDIDGLAFSPDGRLLASGSNEGEVRLWRVDPPELAHVLRGHTGWISSVAFSPDQTTLASAGGDQRIVLWSTANGRKTAELAGHQDTVRSLVFLKKRPLLISSSEDGTVRAWSLTTLAPAEEKFQAMDGEATWVRQLAVEPDETGLWGIVFNRRPVIWNLRDEKFGELYGHPVPLSGNALCMAFQRKSTDAGPVFGYENSVLAAKTDYASEEVHYFGHSSAIRGIAMGEGKWFAISAAADGDVLFWDFRKESHAVRRVKQEDELLEATISPDGQRACFIQSDGVTALIDFETQRVLATSPVKVRPPTTSCFAPDGNVWIADGEGRIRRLHGETLHVESEATLTHRPREIHCDPSGRWLLAVLEDRLLLIDGNDGVTKNERQMESKVRQVEVLDSSTILGVCEDATLRLWRTPTLEIIGEKQLGRAPLDAVTVSPDRAHIAVGGYQAVWILDQSLSVVATLPHVDYVAWMAYLGNGRTLATKDDKGATRLWNTVYWQEVASHNSLLKNLGKSVSRDGFRSVSRLGKYTSLIDARPSS